MLPSTGYFKAVICPFFDSGSCDRPYCHFRHVKKEYNTTSSPVVESGTMFQKLVSEAVQKALKQTDTPSPSTGTQLADDTLEEMSVVTHVQTTPKATYNPTPISELNKIHNVDSEDIEDAIEQRRKHIPVPYTPRKPGAASVKRSVDANDSSKSLLYVPAPVTYTPGCTEPVLLDPYTPKGSTESNEKYLPGSGIELQEYTPKETPLSTKRNYIPSDKNSSKKKILEYKPVKISPQIEKSVVTYKPTLKYLAPCFSSDEDEPDTKKTKLSSDLNGLDDLGPEFDILDQILDEEKNEERDEETSTNAVTKEKPKEKKSNNKESKKKSYDHSKKDKDATNKSENRKSHDKIKPDNREKQSSNAKVKKESKTRSLDKKPHKSSSKDKERKHEQTTDNKKQSSTKTTDKRSKHPEHRSSKISSSSSSKSDPKRKDKNYKRSKESNNKHKKSKAEDTIHNDLYDNNNTHSDDGELAQNNEELYEMSESDEETIALECKRIFEEYIPQEKATKYLENMTNTPLEDIPEKEYVSSKKRISRTMGKDIKIMPKAQAKPNFKVSAAQTMAERLIKVREYHTSKTASSSINSDDVVPKADLSKSTSTTPNTGNSKIRIAHVPYASTLMSVKKTIKPNPILKKDEPSTSSTVIQTIKKGTQRVAHLPNEKFIDRPSVLEPLASKIPINIRSTYLNMMIDECLKIYLSAVDAYARAQHEELATSKKCSTVPIYKNSAVLTVSRLRRELQDCNGIKKSGAECAALQNIPQVISGKSNYSGSWSIENKNRRVLDNAREFNGAKLYNNIRKWILTEQQLQDNGFPRPHSSGEKGRAMIYSQNKQKPPKGVIRTCCRCKKDYIIDKKGFPAVKAECIYHPNNKYRVRGEAKYQCCSQDATSDGCCIAPCHVYEYVDYENLKGYVRTLPPGSVLDDYGVYSLDCEMCYTTQGLDLTRITVIDSSCKVVYETLVRPLHPIIDYNTRYSGITEEQMVEVKTTLLEVQATLLTMFSSKTILIGHSLESDCKALKLIHDTVIDTSVLFPHKMGPPYKRALRNLSSEYLKKIIQNSVDGHDSAEDATVCMELIIYKLKEDLKTR